MDPGNKCRDDIQLLSVMPRFRRGIHAFLVIAGLDPAIQSNKP